MNLYWDITCYMEEDFALLVPNDGAEPEKINFDLVRTEQTVLMFYINEGKNMVPSVMIPLTQVRKVLYKKTLL